MNHYFNNVNLAFERIITWMVCEMGSKWLYTCCFVGYFFKTTHGILVLFPWLDFSPCILLESRSFIHVILVIWQQPGRIPFYSIRVIRCLYD